MFEPLSVYCICISHDHCQENNKFLWLSLQPTIRKGDRISIGGLVIECTASEESDSVTEFNLTRKSIVSLVIAYRKDFPLRIGVL